MLSMPKLIRWGKEGVTKSKKHNRRTNTSKLAYIKMQCLDRAATGSASIKAIAKRVMRAKTNTTCGGTRAA